MPLWQWKNKTLCICWKWWVILWSMWSELRERAVRRMRVMTFPFLSSQGAEYTAPASTAGQWELVGAGRGGPGPGLHAAPAREGGPPAGDHPGQQAAALCRDATAAGGGAIQAGGGGAKGPQLPEPGSQSEVREMSGFRILAPAHWTSITHFVLIFFVFYMSINVMRVMSNNVNLF